MIHYSSNLIRNECKTIVLVCDNGLSQEISKIYKVKPGYTEVIKTKEKKIKREKEFITCNNKDCAENSLDVFSY